MRSKRITTFTNRFPLIGPLFWQVSIQYFAVQVIVALAWKTKYSLANNVISDLGNSACAPYADRFVCSPLHTLMNASFITLGATMIIGAILIYHGFKQSLGSAIGFTCMALAGFGTILVGLYPENTILPLHVIGAALPFFIGNLGMVILGFSLDLTKPLRIYTIISGLIPLIALVLFLTHTYLGLGEGGMERVVAYPQTVWLIVFGMYIMRTRYRTRS